MRRVGRIGLLGHCLFGSIVHEGRQEPRYPRPQPPGVRRRPPRLVQNGRIRKKCGCALPAVGKGGHSIDPLTGIIGKADADLRKACLWRVRKTPNSTVLCPRKRICAFIDPDAGRIAQETFSACGRQPHFGGEDDYLNPCLKHNPLPRQRCLRGGRAARETNLTKPHIF